MRDAPESTLRETESGVEHPFGQASQRTAAAARELLRALVSDAAALGVVLRRRLIAAAQWLRRRAALRLALRHAAASARTAQAAAVRRAAAARRPTGTRAWAHATGRVLRRFALGIAVVSVCGALVFSGAMLWALRGLPFDHPAGRPPGPTLLLAAADGTPLGRFGPLKLPDASLSDYSPVLIDAVISTEDRRFYSHFGFDPWGIIRAAHRNAGAGGIVEGGSTITQQLVKMRYLDGERTYRRKLREVLTAIWLEAHLGKKEILTRYLNSVYLGAGAYGMAAASRLYFARRPADLTLAQAAMLAGLIRAPSELNPLRHLAAAQQRAAVVLDGMVANGSIDATAAASAKANPATTTASPQVAAAASWFTDWVGRQAADMAGADARTVRVRTTLQPDVQRLAQDILDAALAREGRARGVSQGALVAMRPDGSVVAMVGGRDYGASQFNRAVEANRQPGSAFKLFVYLAALRKGYSPDDLIDAGPVDVHGWEPENYGEERYGRIPLAEAFARSVNTAAVRLAMRVGLDQVIAAARDLGIHSPLSPVPSLALGAVGVSPLELTSAFASVRADRMGVTPWGVAAIGPANDKPLRTTGAPVGAGRTLDPYDQPLVDLLRGVVEHGTGRAAALHGFAAGKTGTSQDYRDAWFVGFDDTLVAGVWLGNDDNSPMRRVVGGSLPAAIWKDFMIRATPLVANEPTSVAAAPDTNGADVSGAGSGPPLPDASAQDGAGRCDIAACTGAYRSFRASDCTYQPFAGPRRVCELGEQPLERADAGRGDAAEPRAQDSSHRDSSREMSQTPSRGPCNVDVCTRHYASFDPPTCTYQPYDGGSRRPCEK